MNTVATLGATE